MAAARDAGVRLTLLDTLYLHGGLAPGRDPGTPSRSRTGAVRRRDGPRLDTSGREPAGSVPGTGHQGRGGGPLGPRPSTRSRSASRRAGPGAGPAPPRSPLGAACRERDLPRGPRSNPYRRAGRTQVRWVRTPPWSTPPTSPADDIDLIGAARTHCCFCPTTEHDLADGIGPSQSLVRAGATLCAGSDSQAVIDILEGARAVELGARVLTNRRGIHPTETLAAIATATGTGHSVGRMEAPSGRAVWPTSPPSGWTRFAWPESTLPTFSTR